MQGNADAQYALGLSYAAGRGVPSDDVEAKRWFDQAAIGFRRAADQGDMQAQQMLGHMMLYGRGVPKDEAEALKWFCRGADQGGALGQYYVGLLYSNGMGIPRGYAEAAKWYRKAADQGQIPAQFFSDGFTPTVRACPKTIRRRSSGSARRLNAAIATRRAS